MTAAISFDRSKQPQPADLKSLAGVALLAGAITLSLFSAMQALIRVDDFSPPDQTYYDLIKFEPIEIDVPKSIIDRTVRPIDPVTPPAKPPPLVSEIDVVDVPLAGYTGAAPANYGEVDLDLIKPREASTIIDRGLLPIAPPVPAYPRRAIMNGIEGSCDVYLSVSPRGAPFNVSANCTDHLFESAAISAVQRVKFAPQIRDGLPVTVTGVVYPLEFRMEP